MSAFLRILLFLAISEYLRPRRKERYRPRHGFKTGDTVPQVWNPLPDGLRYRIRAAALLTALEGKTHS